MKTALIRILALILLFPACLQANVAPANPPPAKPPQTEVAQMVIYEEPLQFIIHPSRDDFVEVSFFLFSKKGEVKDLTVAPREAKTPEGFPMNLEKFKITKGSGTVTPEGIKITLALPISELLRPGDYKITLRFEGKQSGQVDGKPPEVDTLTKVLTLNQPVATINLDELKDHTMKLTKWIPGCAGSGEYPLVLINETVKKIPIRNLTLSGQEVFREQTKTQAIGNISVDPANKDCLTVDDKLPLKVKLSKFEQTGTFTTGILLMSPSFDKSIRIPLKIEVSDKWLFPLLSICIGVFAGFGIRYLSKTYKPRQENALRLIKLKDTINRQQRACKNIWGKQEGLMQLDNFEKQRIAAEYKNLGGDIAAAKTLLDQIEKSLDDFLKAKQKESIDTGQAVAKLLDQIKGYRTQDLSGKNTLEDLEHQMIGARNHLVLEEVDQAKGILENYQKIFKKFLLDDELSIYEDRIKNFELTDKAKFDDLIKEIRRLIGYNIEKASEKLESLKLKCPRKRRLLNHLVWTN